MKVKLKTIEQLEKEFEFKYNGYYYTTNFNNWCITDLMLKYLGKEIEVKKLETYFDYTHYDNEIKCYWHESWFEPNDFFKEDEFEI